MDGSSLLPRPLPQEQRGGCVLPEPEGRGALRHRGWRRRGRGAPLDHDLIQGLEMPIIMVTHSTMNSDP